MLEALSRCWRILGNLSLMDWLLGFVKVSILGVLTGVFAWLQQLPIVLSGLIAFTCGYLVWVGVAVQKSLAAQPAHDEQTGTTPETLQSIDTEKAALTLGYNRATFRASGTKDKALLRLTQLRGEGVVIRNESSQLLFTADLNTWVSKVHAWMNDVVETLKPVSMEDSEWFTTLDAVPPARVSIPNIRLGGDFDRQVFIKAFREHDYRLARLEKLLVKHGVGA